MTSAMKAININKTKITILSYFLFLLSIPLLYCQTIPGTEIPGSGSASDSADSYVYERMKALNIPGLAIAITKNGEILQIKTWGKANLETGADVTPESLFMIASLSKSFISAAILLLQQDGKLGLDDKITRYLDSIPDLWKEITVRQLLTHTSGIVRDPADYHPYKEQPVSDVIKSIYTVPLNAQPGEKWLYSNAGYYILAEIITGVSGKPWNSFISERIFLPAGMTGTRIYSTAEIIPLRVSGYHQTAEGLINAEKWIAVRPSSAFLSSIQDMAKWEAFVDHGNLLSESSRKLMWTPGVLKNNTPVNYGLGWYVESFLGRARIHHDGIYPGFRTAYERFPDDHLTVIVIANVDNYRLETIAMKIAGLYEQNLLTPTFSINVKKPLKPVSAGSSVTIETAARAEGRSAPGSILEMEIWDEKGKSVYKQQFYNQDFASGETKSLNFSWTPEKSGTYTVNIGVYGPNWTPSYSWKVNLASLIVN